MQRKSVHIRHEKDAMLLCQADLDLLCMLRDLVTRDGVTVPRVEPGTLLNALRGHGCLGDISIHHCPFHLLGIQMASMSFCSRHRAKRLFAILGSRRAGHH